MGSVTDPSFSQSKAPLESWVTLGRQNKCTEAVAHTKLESIASAVVDFLGQIFFREKNGEPMSEKPPPYGAPCSQLLPRCARQLANL